MVESEGFPRVAWTGAGLWVDLLRVPPSGTWERRKADLYDLADRWVPPATGVTEEQGMRHLVRRYPGGFGPAPLADVASWAGVSVPALPGCYTQGETLEEVQANLREAAEAWLAAAHDQATQPATESGAA